MSVRARAALGATAVVALALVAAGLAVILTLRADLTGQADLQAETAAREVAMQIDDGTPYDRLELPDEQDHPVRVVDAGGQVRAQSDGLGAVSGLPAAPDDASGGDDDTSGGDDGGDDDGSGGDDGGDDDGARDQGKVATEAGYADGDATVDGDVAAYRFAALRATSRDGEEAVVYAGAALATERDAVRTVTVSMLIGLPLLLAVVAGVTWLVTRRALRPVEAIRGEMAEITRSTDLARRVPVPDTRDEVARLARTTNATLAALESSVELQRRFVADASHELRSPIASLRTQLEVGAAHPELLDVDGAVEDVVRLQRLAADLLLLARLDAGEEPAGAVVDLAALVRQETARRPGVHLAAEAARVRGSRGQLARVLGNLLDNAQRHAADAVRVTLRTESGEAVLEVADDGPGVPAGERERIFERFVRLDDARSRDEGGAGLGLAIVRDVVLRHGGAIAVRDVPGGGAFFEVRLPRGPADDGP